LPGLLIAFNSPVQAVFGCVGRRFRNHLSHLFKRERASLSAADALEPGVGDAENLGARSLPSTFLQPRPARVVGVHMNKAKHLPRICGELSYPGCLTPDPETREQLKVAARDCDQIAQEAGKS
jgi:hypothetical protein